MKNVSLQPRNLFVLALITLLAIVLRLYFIHEEPINDELYHVLAAKGWLNTGTFSIADGEYSRGGLFTVALALFGASIDSSIEAYRMFSLIGGITLIWFMFFWVGARTSHTAGAITALLLTISPYALFIDTYIRFYSWHTLFFTIAAFLTFDLLAIRTLTRRFALHLAVILGLLGVSLALQITTVIGVAAIAAGCFATLAVDHRDRIRWRIVLPLGGAVIFLAIAGIFSVWKSGLLDDIVEQYSFGALWSKNTGFLYYFKSLNYWYPTLFSLTPIIAVVALFRFTRVAIFILTCLLVVFVLHSYAGMKAERFIHYALPAYLTLNGLFFAAAIEAAAKLTGRFSQQFSPRQIRAGIFSTGLLMTAMIVLTNPGISAPLRVLSDRILTDYKGENTHWYRYNTKWEELTSMLLDGGFLIDDPAIITSQGVHAIYYLGDYDAEISTSRWEEGDISADGSRTDYRTGRLVVPDKQNLDAAVNCLEHGLIIVNDFTWRNPLYVNDETADYIEQRFERLPEMLQADFHVFRWRPGADCNKTRD